MIINEGASGIAFTIKEVVVRWKTTCGSTDDRHGRIDGSVFVYEYQKILDTINLIKTLPCLDLYGLGTNFNCYGTVLPTVKNGEDFLALASRLERDSGLTIR